MAAVTIYMAQFKPTSEFPLLKKYKKRFNILPGTIFAYDHVIYTDEKLPEHLIIHESTHFKQQDKVGLRKWVKKYLKDDDFRLEMELEAYWAQLASIKNRNEQFKVKQHSCQDLSSDLYGNLLTYEEAFEKLSHVQMQKTMW